MYIIDINQKTMKKPNEIIDIEIKWNNFIPFIGYLAITFFGKMWMRNSTKERWERYIKDGQAAYAINHEMIHVKQAVSTNNSWWEFYVLYIWYWLKAIFRGFTFAYKMNPFEMEAYANENDLNYIATHSGGAVRWKVYKTIPIKTRKAYWKDYNIKRKSEYITFGKYINEYIDPYYHFKEYTL